MKVIWSPLAHERLAAIELFLAEKNTVAAAHTVEKLIEKGDSLSSMPRRGRKVPEIGDEDLRELIVGDYRIVYEVNDPAKRVEIITVLHGRQRFPLEEFLDD